MTPAGILKAARAKIEKPENWAQRAMAWNEEGQWAFPKSPEACKWCGKGAVIAVATDFDDERKAVAILDEIVAPGNRWFSEFNDTHTHPEVLQMFDLAIEKAEGRG